MTCIWDNLSMLKLLALKFESYKKINILLVSFTRKHLTQNIYSPAYGESLPTSAWFFLYGVQQIPEKSIHTEKVVKR
jgi:hypothetical protein